MKKYGFLFMLCVLLCGLLCGVSSCKTKKDIATNNIHSERIERLEKAMGKARETKVESQQVVVRDSTQEVAVAVTTELDTAGRVRKIRKEWRETRSGKLGVGNSRSAHDSMKNNSILLQEKTDSKSDISEKVKSSEDSRPVQGGEWFWVIIGVGVLLAVGFLLWKNEKLRIIK